MLEERGLELLLVSARHVKILPGRKTDVGDAAWLAELLECGLLRGSFVLPAAIRQLRDLVRYRKRLSHWRTVASCGPNAGACRSGVLRAGGTAHSSA